MLVRPLLGLSREETLRYCRESGVEPRDDRTNALPVATRNRVRLELMPLLRTFNPRIDEALVRAAESLEGDSEALEAVAEAEWARLARRRGKTVRFEIEDLRLLPPAVTTRLVRRASAALGAEAPSARQLEAVMATLSSPPAATSLPGDLLAKAGKRWLEIARRDAGS
jgi:tRNA(Ile)-lysidine synthase